MHAFTRKTCSTSTHSSSLTGSGNRTGQLDTEYHSLAPHPHSIPQHARSMHTQRSNNAQDVAAPAPTGQPVLGSSSEYCCSQLNTGALAAAARITRSHGARLLLACSCMCCAPLSDSTVGGVYVSHSTSMWSPPVGRRTAAMSALCGCAQQGHQGPPFQQTSTLVGAGKTVATTCKKCVPA